MTNQKVGILFQAFVFLLLTPDSLTVHIAPPLRITLMAQPSPRPLFGSSRLSPPNSNDHIPAVAPQSSTSYVNFPQPHQLNAAQSAVLSNSSIPYVDFTRSSRPPSQEPLSEASRVASVQFPRLSTASAARPSFPSPIPTPLGVPHVNFPHHPPSSTAEPSFPSPPSGHLNVDPAHVDADNQDFKPDKAPYVHFPQSYPPPRPLPAFPSQGSVPYVQAIKVEPGSVPRVNFPRLPTPCPPGQFGLSAAQPNAHDYRQPSGPMSGQPSRLSAGRSSTALSALPSVSSPRPPSAVVHGESHRRDVISEALAEEHHVAFTNSRRPHETHPAGRSLSSVPYDQVLKVPTSVLRVDFPRLGSSSTAQPSAPTPLPAPSFAPSTRLETVEGAVTNEHNPSRVNFPESHNPDAPASALGTRNSVPYVDLVKHRPGSVPHVAFPPLPVPVARSPSAPSSAQPLPVSTLSSREAVPPKPAEHGLVQRGQTQPTVSAKPDSESRADLKRPHDIDRRAVSVKKSKSSHQGNTRPITQPLVPISPNVDPAIGTISAASVPVRTADEIIERDHIAGRPAVHHFPLPSIADTRHVKFRRKKLSTSVIPPDILPPSVRMDSVVPPPVDVQPEVSYNYTEQQLRAVHEQVFKSECNWNDYGQRTAIFAASNRNQMVLELHQRHSLDRTYTQLRRTRSNLADLLSLLS